MSIHFLVKYKNAFPLIFTSSVWTGISWPQRWLLLSSFSFWTKGLSFLFLTSWLLKCIFCTSLVALSWFAPRVSIWLVLWKCFPNISMLSGKIHSHFLTSHHLFFFAWINGDVVFWATIVRNNQLHLVSYRNMECPVQNVIDKGLTRHGQDHLLPFYANLCVKHQWCENKNSILNQ